MLIIWKCILRIFSAICKTSSFYCWLSLSPVRGEKMFWSLHKRVIIMYRRLDGWLLKLFVITFFCSFANKQIYHSDVIRGRTFCHVKKAWIVKGFRGENWQHRTEWVGKVSEQGKNDCALQEVNVCGQSAKKDLIGSKIGRRRQKSNLWALER